MGKKDRGIKGYEDRYGMWHSTWEKALEANIGRDDHPCPDEKAVKEAIERARDEGHEISPDC